MQCYICGEPHLQKDCPHKGKEDVPRSFCVKCFFPLWPIDGVLCEQHEVFCVHFDRFTFRQLCTTRKKWGKHATISTERLTDSCSTGLERGTQACLQRSQTWCLNVLRKHGRGCSRAPSLVCCCCIRRCTHRRRHARWPSKAICRARSSYINTINNNNYKQQQASTTTTTTTSATVAT